MKNNLILSTLLLPALAFAARAQTETAAGPQSSCCEDCGCGSTAAPAGILNDHVHPAGGWMAGYRFMYQKLDGNLGGTRGVGIDAILDMDEWTSAPKSMDMKMHMFELMYAPTDRLTLMAMTAYNRMDMDMVMEAAAMDAHDHAAMAMPMSKHMGEEHGGGEMETMTHSHSTEGWGDTSVSALVEVWSADDANLVAGLGVGLPTAKVDVKRDGKFTHYGMQLGRGTWDALPSLTLNKAALGGNVGVQAAGVFALEDENDSGFRFGNVVALNLWHSRPLAGPVGVSGRLGYTHQGEVEGHYNGPHNHATPPDLQANYGGEIVEAGLGFTLALPAGKLSAHRFAVEGVVPVHQDLNGIQLERDLTVNLAWQASF
ncbi:MAG: transporter [Kiritimatiellia bacterium]